MRPALDAPCTKMNVFLWRPKLEDESRISFPKLEGEASVKFIVSTIEVLADSSSTASIIIAQINRSI
jgi:hypothetical protein